MMSYGRVLVGAKCLACPKVYLDNFRRIALAFGLEESGVDWARGIELTDKFTDAICDRGSEKDSAW